MELECNGLLTYDRVMKPDVDKIRASNQKAIYRKLALSTLLPTSQKQSRSWKFTTISPAPNWFAVDFDDSAWSSGPGGFGGPTPWRTSDIWLRQEFDLGGLGADDLQNLAFTCCHDEDCEIYLNGVLASRAPGCTTTYVLIAMNEEARRVLHPNGKNLIAVHCHQTEGGQFIDVGISKRVITDDSAAPRKR